MTRESNRDLNPIGERIEHIRARKEIPLTRLAIASNLNYSHFWRIMHSNVRTTRESLMKICLAMHCTVEEADEIFAITQFRSPSQSELDEAPLACPA